MANEISTIESLANSYKVEESLAFDGAEKLYCHGVRAGIYLNKIKETLPHGGFETWCEVNTRYKKSHRTRLMLIAREEFDNDFAKVPSKGLLDILSHAKLLSILDDKEERTEHIDAMQGKTQKETSDYLKELAEAKAEAQRARDDADGWKSDGMKFRSEVRAKQDRIDTLEKQLAEQPKVVFQTDNGEAIRQATEEKEKQLADAKDQLKRTKADFQKDVDRIVQRRLAEKSDELTKLQGEINYAQIQAQRAGQEYSDIVAKKDRTIEAQGILEAVQKSRFELIEKLDFLLTGELTKIQLTDLTGTLERYSELTNDSLIFIKKLNGANP